MKAQLGKSRNGRQHSPKYKTGGRPAIRRAGPTRRFLFQFWLFFGGCGPARARNTPLRTACCSEPLISATNGWDNGVPWPLYRGDPFGYCTVAVPSATVSSRDECVEGIAGHPEVCRPWTSTHIHTSGAILEDDADVAAVQFRPEGGVCIPRLKRWLCPPSGRPAKPRTACGSDPKFGVREMLLVGTDVLLRLPCVTFCRAPDPLFLLCFKSNMLQGREQLMLFCTHTKRHAEWRVQGDC